MEAFLAGMAWVKPVVIGRDRIVRGYQTLYEPENFMDPESSGHLEDWFDDCYTSHRFDVSGAAHSEGSRVILKNGSMMSYGEFSLATDMTTRLAFRIKASADGAKAGLITKDKGIYFTSMNGVWSAQSNGKYHATRHTEVPRDQWLRAEVSHETDGMRSWLGYNDQYSWWTAHWDHVPLEDVAVVFKAPPAGTLEIDWVRFQQTSGGRR